MHSRVIYSARVALSVAYGLSRDPARDKLLTSAASAVYVRVCLDVLVLARMICWLSLPGRGGFIG